MRPAGDGATSLGGCCKLVLRACDLIGLMPALCGAVGVLSLAGSQPRDMMDSDLP